MAGLEAASCGHCPEEADPERALRGGGAATFLAASSQPFIALVRSTSASTSSSFRLVSERDPGQRMQRSTEAGRPIDRLDLDGTCVGRTAGSGPNSAVVTREDLDEWLGLYGGAWEARDREAAARLFTEDAVYCFAARLPDTCRHSSHSGPRHRSGRG
jgi:hypothetical protein